mmetsp:Transcript_22883/g.49608  ORF Transcript_22883/g.49608 Transcript_22883/m.49608 type:complete len:220 (-) Transcript_22883:71-730(-)
MLSSSLRCAPRSENDPPSTSSLTLKVTTLSSPLTSSSPVSLERPRDASNRMYLPSSSISLTCTCLSNAATAPFSRANASSVVQSNVHGGEYKSTCLTLAVDTQLIFLSVPPPPPALVLSGLTHPLIIRSSALAGEAVSASEAPPTSREDALAMKSLLDGSVSASAGSEFSAVDMRWTCTLCRYRLADRAGATGLKARDSSMLPRRAAVATPTVLILATM